MNPLNYSTQITISWVSVKTKCKVQYIPFGDLSALFNNKNQ